MSNFIIGNNNRLRGTVENLQAIGCNDKEFTSADNNKTTIQNDSVIITTTEMVVSPSTNIVHENYSIETGVAVAVAPGKRYSFAGGTASTWTLESMTNNTGIETWIYNRGTEVITVNSSDSPADTIYYNGAAVSTFKILPGENIVLYGDSDYILASGIKKPRVFIGAVAPTFFEDDDIWLDI